MLDIERDIHVNLRVYLERQRERDGFGQFPEGSVHFPGTYEPEKRS